MEGPRSPRENEFPQVVQFLNQNLRAEAKWSISAEYPTALNSFNLHNMKIITEDDRILSHAVLKPLIIKSPHVIFKVGAIGSVVTDQQHRGQGLSTQILQQCINDAQKQQCDAVILWTDLYDFYRKLGFELAGSEVSFVINEQFQAQETGLRFSSENNVSPEAIFRLYNQHNVNTVRTVDDIKKYLTIPQTKVYTAWSSDNTLVAYAIEGKGADLGGYIHEWGGNVSKMLALLSYIRKTKNEAFTIICPEHSINLIQNLAKIAEVKNHGFLGMIKIVNFPQFSSKIKRAFRAEGVSDIVIEQHQDHYLFGFSNQLYTLNNESDIVRLLFGPVNYEDLELFNEENLKKLKKIFPLQFWIWGWDSI